MKSSRRVAILVLGAVLGFVPFAAHAAEPAEAEELKRLSVAWMEALEKKDEVTLRALMAPEYTLYAPGDREEILLEEWIGNAVRLNWTRPRYEELRVRLSGDHAVVTSRFHFRVSPMPFGLDAGLVDTWERRNGRWQVTGRYLGESNTQERIRYIQGFLTALLLWGAKAAWARLARIRKARAANLA